MMKPIRSYIHAHTQTHTHTHKHRPLPGMSTFAMIGPVFLGQVHAMQLDLGFRCSMSQSGHLRSSITKNEQSGSRYKAQ